MALLDKFRTGRNGAPLSEAESVIDSLSEVLNTRRGFGSFLPNFGIMDLSDRVSREQIALAVVREVQYCIEAYEPRITVREIKQVPQVHPTRLAFSIECTIGAEKRPLEMVFDAALATFELGAD